MCVQGKYFLFVSFDIPDLIEKWSEKKEDYHQANNQDWKQDGIFKLVMHVFEVMVACLSWFLSQTPQTIVYNEISSFLNLCRLISLLLYLS
jgi:hypothetical protein